MRRSGLRLVQFWVPDTRVPGFSDECRRQSKRAARRGRLEREVLEWVDRTSDPDSWTA